MTPEDRAELERWRASAAATPDRTARTLLDACNAVEALDQENTRLTYQRDQAREATDRHDAFVNELCMLIPDDRDDDVAAEAIIVDWVKELLADRDRARDAAVALEQENAAVRAYAERCAKSSSHAYAKAGRELLAILDGGEG